MSEEFSAKYYTAFILFMKDIITDEPKMLHCTHKYLGQQTNEAMNSVATICDNYFFDKKPQFPIAIFKEEDFFGENKDIRVLKSHIHTNNFFLDLRDSLEQFRPDDFPLYNPHITIDGYPEVVGLFQAYAIMTGEKLVMYWSNPVCEKIQRREKKPLSRPKLMV